MPRSTTTANGSADGSLPQVTRSMAMRTVNSGAPELISADRAAAEIEGARSAGRHAVSVMRQDRHGCATIAYRDTRGLVELRPATGAEAARGVAEQRFARGEAVVVRAVHYDPVTRRHTVQRGFLGTVVGVVSGRYRVADLGAGAVGEYSEREVLAEAAWPGVVVPGTQWVGFEELAVGDVLVRGPGGEQRALVLRPAEDYVDFFGRPMRRLWCQDRDDAARCGWVPFGPGGVTRRLVPRRGAREGLPVQGQVSACSVCWSPILWLFEGPEAESGGTRGRWVDQHGCGTCPAVSGDARTFPHLPAYQEPDPLERRCAAAAEAEFGRIMDAVAVEDSNLVLAALLQRACDLAPALGADAPGGEALRAALHAAAGTSHLVTGAALAVLVARLWLDGTVCGDRRAAVAGAAVADFGVEAVRSAVAAAREGGVALAVLPEGWPWRTSARGFGVAGVFFTAPFGEPVRAVWVEGGREDETGLSWRRVREVRSRRNGQLEQLARVLAAAGWTVSVEVSAAARTRRVVALLAAPPRLR
ncbi:hypothetical protein [Streptacidiphilus sp. EB103A]|uniref:hypothetical protein n=1 Tax=Streptacidiphilus sp. EB103A TaxID=3156275 RepID=UPI003514CE89